MTLIEAPRIISGNVLDRTTVRELMSAGVVSMPEDASLRQAARAMRDHRIGGVLVVDCVSGKPLGWVTAPGLLPWMDRDAHLVQLRDAISEPAPVVQPSATARDGRRPRNHELQASLTMLPGRFEPCAVKLGGRPLAPAAWSYSPATGVLRARFRTRAGTLTADGSC